MRYLSKETYPQISQYAEDGLALEEIAVLIGVRDSGKLASDSRIAKLISNGHKIYQARLRQAQLQVALGTPTVYERDSDGNIMTDKYGHPYIKQAGNPPNAEMLKFLGKNNLGQADKQEDSRQAARTNIEKQTVYVFTGGEAIALPQVAQGNDVQPKELDIDVVE